MRTQREFIHYAECDFFNEVKNKLNIQTLNDMRTRRLSKEQGKQCNISRFPNFHKSGSIKGMKRIYYGMDALLVRCGDYIYNVSSEPNIYYQASI